jgi:ribosomal protein L7/L12
MQLSRETIQECEKLGNEKGDVEPILALLRTRGYSKVQSIAALAEVQKLSLQEAKELVHRSSCWSDVRTQDDEFQDTIIESLGVDEERSSATAED